MYPYIATLKHPSTISEAIALDFLEPTKVGSHVKQSLILQYPHELAIYQVHQDRITHLYSHPIFTQILALKKIKHIKDCNEDLLRKDFLFMMTKDLKLTLLHFNQSQQTIEIISTIQIDMQFGGNGQKEVLHISYDSRTRVIVVVFL